MMKRVIVIITILCLLTGTLYANLTLGGAVGIVHSNMDGVNNNSTEASGRWNGNFGFFLQYSLGMYFFVMPALFLTWRGFTKTHLQSAGPYNILSNTSSINASNEMTEEVSLGYIQIPILFKYEISLEGNFTPRILLGPSFAFNISANNKISGFGQWDGEYNIGNLKTLDISGIIGIGVSFPIGKLMCGVDVIYDKSFSSAFSDVTEQELANDVNEELWTKTDPVTFERTTEAVDFSNNGFLFQFSVILPIQLGK